jgi:predicted acylesterase/phospholipase RssA
MAGWAEGNLSRGLFHFRPSPGALLGVDRIHEVLTEALGSKTFADVRCPLALTAVDLETGTEVVLTSGELVEAVLATIALPGIFPPQWSGGSRLVDGGVVDPVPVQPVRALHRAPVVAVALSARPGSPPATAASPLTYVPGSGMFSRLRIGQALQVFGRSLEISSRLFTDLRWNPRHSGSRPADRSRPGGDGRRVARARRMVRIARGHPPRGPRLKAGRRWKDHRRRATSESTPAGRSYGWRWARWRSSSASAVS